MTKDEMALELKAYINHIIFASDCLIAYMSIIDATKNEADLQVINRSTGFFTITKYAIAKCMCVEIAKLFIGSGKEKTIYKLINVINANQNVFPKKRIQEFLLMDEQNKYEFLETKIDIQKDIKEFEDDLKNYETTITNLKIRRNVLLTHNDPDYFYGNVDLTSKIPLKDGELHNLLSLTGDFCNKMLVYLTGHSICTNSINADDLRNLLQYHRK